MSDTTGICSTSIMRIFIYGNCAHVFALFVCKLAHTSKMKTDIESETKWLQICRQNQIKLCMGKSLPSDFNFTEIFFPRRFHSTISQHWFRSWPGAKKAVGTQLSK